MFTEKEPKKEEWRKLVNYPGYSVSSLGRVRSDPHKVWNGNGWYTTKEKILKPNILAKGYLQVELRNAPNRHPRQVHRLVAEAFISNPNNFPQVNHKNGIKNDNRVENLEWCDNSMNQIHAYAMGLNKRSNNAGKKKRPIVLTHAKTGEVLHFDSIADARRFLGKWSGPHIYDALKNKRGCYTVKGYIVNYGVEIHEREPLKGGKHF